MTDSPNVASVIRREWMTALDLRDCAPDDDYFGLGGNSLGAVRLAQRIEEALGIRFPIDALFLEGTLNAVIVACEAEMTGLRAQ